jgi:hypothetical protein
MIFVVDPLLATIVVAGGLFGLGVIWGSRIRLAANQQLVQQSIDHTVQSLINDGFLATTLDSSGDTVIIPLAQLFTLHVDSDPKR